MEALLGWFPAIPLHAQLAYTYSNFKYTNVQSLAGTFSDQYMPIAPEHQAYLDVEVTPAPTRQVFAGVHVWLGSN